jgi:hypothetical protein
MFQSPVDGQVYAQPVIAGGTVIVATEKNNIYGIDSITGARKWSRNVGVPWNPNDVACADLRPSVGITGTPVVDSAKNTAYFFSKTYASGTSGAAAWYAHAIDVGTGAERTGFPVLIQGIASNDAGKAFNPTTQLQRAGLLLLDGVVYAGFGGHCDHQPYSGWVVRVTTAGRVSTLWTSSPGDTGAAGIWQSGGGLVSDGPGSIILATGNGSTNVTPRAGSDPGSSLGESVVHLRVQADGTLEATDFFAPYDADTLDTWDADLASGGPVLLPATPFSTPAHPRLVAIAGKQGYLYLLDASDLGGMRQGPSGGDRVVARFGPFGGVWGQVAAWPGDGGYLYLLPPASFLGDGAVRALKWSIDGAGVPSLVEVGRSAETAGFGSTAAVVSSDGTTSGTALLWVIARAADGSGQLRAYDAVPVNGRLPLRWSASLGMPTKFSLPTIFKQRVYVGTLDGRLLSFGSPVSQPLSGGPLTMANTQVGGATTANLTLRATTDLSVSGIGTTNAAFTVGNPTTTNPPQSGLPILVPTGSTLTVPVRFAPTGPGPASGEVRIMTTVREVDVAVSGLAVNPTGLLQATPPVLSFGGAPAGGTAVTAGLRIDNVGATAVTVNQVTQPSTPFSVTRLPAAGTQIPPLGSVTAIASFAPQAVGDYDDLITLDTSAGKLEVPLSGTSAPPPMMTFSTRSVSIGSVLVGATRTGSFTLTNTGGSPLLVTKSKPPAAGAGFQALTTLPEASTIAPGGSVTETVAFQPTGPGTFSDTWILNGNDGVGERAVTFTGTGVTGTVFAGPSATPWSTNGSAARSDPWLQLTDSTLHATGSSLAPTTLSASSLLVSFDTYIGFGTGAEGLTVMFADAGRGAGPTSLGAGGGGLGFAGIPGLAVALDTFQSPGDPGSNFVGLTDGAGVPPAPLHWLTTSTEIPYLRANRHIDASIVGGFLAVRVDGTLVLTRDGVALPSNVQIGFTGATGDLTDHHMVTSVSISYR